MLAIFPFVLFIAMWCSSEVERSHKWMLTGLYSVTFLIAPFHPTYFIGGQALSAILMGAATFGVDWLNQSIR